MLCGLTEGKTKIKGHAKSDEEETRVELSPECYAPQYFLQQLSTDRGATVLNFLQGAISQGCVFHLDGSYVVICL